MRASHPCTTALPAPPVSAFRAAKAALVRPLSVALLAAAVLATTVPTAPPARAGEAAATFALPAGTPIPVVFDHEIGATTGATGSAPVYVMEVAQDVILGGMLVARRGDVVNGRIATDRHATQRLLAPVTSETIVLDVDEILTYCDARIPVRFERTMGGTMQKVGNLNVRRHAVFARGTVLLATVTTPAVVCATPTDVEAVPLTATLLPSDEDIARKRAPGTK